MITPMTTIWISFQFPDKRDNVTCSDSNEDEEDE